MERVLDKVMLLALTAFLAATQPYSSWLMAAGLACVSISALFDVESLPVILRVVLVYLYLLVSLINPHFLLFLPLISYDCYRVPSLLFGIGGQTNLLLQFGWTVALLVGLFTLSPLVVLLTGALSALACLRSWQSGQLDETLNSYRIRRDELAAISQSLEARTHDLQDRQSLELRLATLAERSRIAREIHDNVGHMLTRSVLQVEALQVMHTDDTDLTRQLTGIADNLHEAYQSVRQSVHGLHTQSFELHTQLLALAQETESLAQNNTAADNWQLQVSLEYDLSQDPPSDAVSYAILAITKEALANSLKHSNATQIKVALSEYPGFYQLIIQDNGSQPPASSRAGGNPYRDSAAPYGSRGIGLTNMDERARSLGGICNTSFTQGFRVFVTIPREV